MSFKNIMLRTLSVTIAFFTVAQIHAQSYGPEQIISTNARFAFAVHAADLDGDNDPDVLSASSGDNKVAWYENTDGLGTFSAEKLISNIASGASSVYAAPRRRRHTRTRVLTRPRTSSVHACAK